MRTYMRIWAHICIYAGIYCHICEHIRIYACIYAYMRAYMRAYMHICIYVRTCAFRHAYKHLCGIYVNGSSFVVNGGNIAVVRNRKYLYFTVTVEHVILKYFGLPLPLSAGFRIRKVIFTMRMVKLEIWSKFALALLMSWTFPLRVNG